MNSRVSDPVKIQQWSERLSRFGDSGQTVAEFCRAECVSQPSFYRDFPVGVQRPEFLGSDG